MEGLKFINCSDSLNRWDVEKVFDICNKVRLYTKTHNLNNVELYSVEDNTWSDKKNQRYDIEIRYIKNGRLIQQKLLVLNGEVLDGKEFCDRYNDFYN